MHQTKTVDYIILLSGEVTLLLDEDGRDLKPFDVVVQRGTNHARINKGKEPALLVAVLIDVTLANAGIDWRGLQCRPTGQAKGRTKRHALSCGPRQSIDLCALQNIIWSDFSHHTLEKSACRNNSSIRPVSSRLACTRR